MPSQKPKINFCTTQEIINQMKKIADENDRTLSKEVERACKFYIESYKKQQNSRRRISYTLDCVAKRQFYDESGVFFRHCREPYSLRHKLKFKKMGATLKCPIFSNFLTLISSLLTDSRRACSHYAKSTIQWHRV